MNTYAGDALKQKNRELEFLNQLAFQLAEYDPSQGPFCISHQANQRIYGSYFCRLF